jgi:hypothetical protein
VFFYWIQEICVPKFMAHLLILSDFL